MTRALRRLGLCCLVLASCDPGDDIVARPLSTGDVVKEDAGSGSIPDANEQNADAGTAAATDADAPAPCCDSGAAVDLPQAGAAGPRACASGSDTFLLLTREPFLYRVFAEAGTLEPRGAPSCLPPGDFAAAVDAEGRLWAVPGDGVARVIDPDSLACNEIALNLTPQAMAFVYNPENAAQRLYVLQDGVLLDVDTASLANTPLGTLAPSWLAGTADGRLFAISDRDDDAILFEALDTRDASRTGETWTLAAPSSAPLSGVAMHAYDLSLLFGTALFRAGLASNTPKAIAPLFEGDPGIVAVAAPPCAFPPK